jgi:hypothetical protein
MIRVIIDAVLFSRMAAFVTGGRDRRCELPDLACGVQASTATVRRASRGVRTGFDW